MDDLQRWSLTLMPKPIDFLPSIQKPLIRISISETLNLAVKGVSSTAFRDPNTNLVDLLPPSDLVPADMANVMGAEIEFSDGSESFFVCIRPISPESHSFGKCPDNGVRCTIYRGRPDVVLLTPGPSPAVRASS
jgi:hypothetical protein